MKLLLWMLVTAIFKKLVHWEKQHFSNNILAFITSLMLCSEGKWEPVIFTKCLQQGHRMSAHNSYHYKQESQWPHSPVLSCKLLPALLWPMNKGGGADHASVFSLRISNFYGFKFPNLKEESCAHTYSLIFSHLSSHLMYPDITLFRLISSLPPLAVSLFLHSLHLLQYFSCTECP